MTTEYSGDGKHYKPEVRDVDELAGLSMHSAKKGEQVKVLRRSFFTSYQDNHHRFFDQVLGSVLGPNLDNLNEVLIVIRGRKAYIYKYYPMMFAIRPKENIQAHRAVFENQILDIVEVKFKDARFDLDIKDGDKFVWLFREGWSFGLYFDFTGEMRVDDLWGELGECYRKIRYYSLYMFLSTGNNFNNLLTYGWFPFVQILGDEFDRLVAGIEHKSTKEMTLVENNLLNSFTKERVDNFTRYWWQNEIFEQKRELLSAGINAYFKGDADSIINSIKTLTSEIEGVIRLDYHRVNGKKPNTKELKDYVLSQGRSKFSAPDSRGFPGLFFNYLENVFFRDFDIDKDDVQLSRHSVSHGVVTREKYTKARALQLILTLDQIYFYFGKSKSIAD